MSDVETLRLPPSPDVMSPGTSGTLRGADPAAAHPQVGISMAARLQPGESLVQHLHALIAARELLMTWTLREVKVRYRQSLLGIAWAIFQPLALMLAYTIVFSQLLRLPSDGVPYAVFVYVALLPWTFFSTSLGFGASSLISNLALITKIYFPREILPLATVGVAFLDFLVASSLFVGLLLWYHIPFTWTMLWTIPLVLIQVILTLGVVLPIAALNVLYRDVRFLVPVVLQLWLYATPIIYPLSVVPDSYRLLYALNPLVGIMDSYRRVTLLGIPPDPALLAFSATFSLTLVVLGYMFFKHVEEQFADLI